MKINNKILVGILSFLLTFPALSYTVFAESTQDAPVQSFNDIVNLFEKAADWLFRIFFIVAVIYILLAAYKYLRAGEKAEEVEKANKMIKNAVIAIIIALLSGSFALIIKNFIS